MELTDIGVWNLDAECVRFFERLRKALGHIVTLEPRGMDLTVVDGRDVVTLGWFLRLRRGWEFANFPDGFPTVEIGPNGSHLGFEMEYLEMHVRSPRQFTAVLYETPRVYIERRVALSIHYPEEGGWVNIPRTRRYLARLWVQNQVFYCHMREWLLTLVELFADLREIGPMIQGLDRELRLPKMCKTCGHMSEDHFQSTGPCGACAACSGFNEKVLAVAR